MSRASLGSVFQKRYRDRVGRLRATRNWYIEYTLPRRMKTCREATQFTSKADAQRLLRQRMGDADAGKVALKPETTFEDLKQLILADHEINRRDSLYDLQRTRLPKLTEFFGGFRATAIRTRDVERYKLWRLGLRASEAEDGPGAPTKVLRETRPGAKGAAPATVNRELAALKRMFRLAIDQELIGTRPRIALLKEDNVRTGFFEWDEFVAFLAHRRAQPRARRRAAGRRDEDGWPQDRVHLQALQHRRPLDADPRRGSPGPGSAAAGSGAAAQGR
ncbi:MAG: hypothetical protein IMZ69_02990 [Spirochaetes bacterium]|nr:hypothetical protein [Spirochaetota bacterium]